MAGKALFGAVQQTRDIRPVAPDDECCHRDREVKYRAAMSSFQHCHHNRQSEGRQNGGDGNVSGEKKDGQPNEENGEGGDRDHTEESASRGGDSLAAFEFEPDWKRVTRDAS